MDDAICTDADNSEGHSNRTRIETHLASKGPENLGDSEGHSNRTRIETQNITHQLFS